MKSFFVIAIIVVLLTGCDKAAELGRIVATEQKLTDVYPAIQPGAESLKAIAMSTDRLSLADSETVIFKLQNDCNIIADATIFGTHSVQFTPASIYCPNSAQTQITTDQISIAFIDTRFFDPSRTEVVFQIYDLSLFSHK